MELISWYAKNRVQPEIVSSPKVMAIRLDGSVEHPNWVDDTTVSIGKLIVYLISGKYAMAFVGCVIRLPNRMGSPLR